MTALGWASPMAHPAPRGTLWCVPCARVQLRTAAAWIVDGDPCCDNCAPREATLSGEEQIPLKPNSALSLDCRCAVAPLRPDPQTKSPEVKPVPTSNRLTLAQRIEIRSADPSISDKELAKKYSVTAGSIWYQRRKVKKDSAAVAKATGVASELPPLRRNGAEA